MLRDGIAHTLLEEKGTLLHGGVQQPVHEDARVDVLLGVGAEVLVLRHDALVHRADGVEVFVAGVLVAEDFVSHCGLSGAVGDESLDEEEVWSGLC